MKPLSADRVRVGFIGVGVMGSRVVRRLLDHDYAVVVYNRDRNKAAGLAASGAGAVVASTVMELAENVDVIMSCLTNDDAVRNVFLGGDGILTGKQAGKVVLEMSTISPDTSRELHAEGARYGMKVMDVAISGSAPAVEQGTVTLLAGGDAEVFEAAQPIFQAFASQYFLLGPSGAGTSMKLAVNAILGTSMQAIAEAIALGEAEGLDRKVLLNVLSKTAVIAPAHKGKLARAEDNDYSPQFAVGLMNKDFRLILETARSLNLDMPTTSAAFQVNSAAFEEDSTADFSSVIRQMEKLVEPRVSELSGSTRSTR